MRFFPSWFINRSLKTANNKGKNVFLYLHPREIDPNSPRLSLPPLERLIHYYGINGCEKKLVNVISENQKSLMRIGDHIRTLSNQ